MVTHLGPPVGAGDCHRAVGSAAMADSGAQGRRSLAAAATGVESNQYSLWGLGPSGPLSPWHECCPHASHGLQGSFLTWQPHLWPLEIQGLNCCSLMSQVFQNLCAFQLAFPSACNVFPC